MEETLNSSVLGTREYWDEAYEKELKNYTAHGDVGEVWFGEMISKRIIKWIAGSDKIRKDDRIIDIGCGNGMLLIELSRAGYTQLHGVDYSKNAIDLASSIAEKEGCTDLQFSVQNILEETISDTYDLALDKGTYDAISLDPNDSKTKREVYIRNVLKLLRKDGLFMITSCNWTEDELKKQFTSCFHYVETLPTPSFTFGGQKGNTVTSVVFQKQ